MKQFLALVNRAAREVGARIDLRSTKRRSQLSPSIFQQVYQYTKPTDMKGLGLIDIMPQVKRSSGHAGEWVLTTPEEFDRMKRVYRLVAAVYDADGVGRLWLSAVVDDDKLTLHECDSLTGDGTWAVVTGSAHNLTLDNYNYVNGNASLNFDVDTSDIVPSIQNTTMEAKDLTDFQGQPLFAWVFIPSGGLSKVSSITLRWGSGTGAYYQRAVTTTNEGLAFQAGWNLLRFDWDTSVTEVGVPDITDITFLRLIITLSGVLTAEVTDWRLDFVVVRKGVIHDVIYYSKYMWQSSAGTYLENSTASTDLLNADTEEFDLIVARLDYLLAKAQRNQFDIKIAREDYLLAEANYKLNYPSEAKLLTTSYYNLPSLGESVGLGEMEQSDTL